MKDQLFLLRPGFMNGDKGPFYCGDSIAVEGLLGFFPELREAIDVHYIEFPRPRTAIVELIGEQHQSIPVLVLAAGRSPGDATLSVNRAGERGFIDREADIRRYLCHEYGLPQSG